MDDTGDEPARGGLGAEVEAAIDEVMGEHVGTDRPGGVVGVVRDGALVFVRGYGMADVARGIPNGRDTIFDIASTSKQITAAVVLLLAAEGALGLDDELRRYVPEAPAGGARAITLEHLLHHTSGLPDYIDGLLAEGRRIDEVVTVDDALDVVARGRELRFEPGTRFAYCDTGYFLLALVVERATGRSLREVAAARIFGPLGMTSTGYLDPRAPPHPRRARGYAPDGDGWRLEETRWEQIGDGAVLTTVEDLARWDRNFVERVVGGRGLVDALERRGRLADGTALDYAGGIVHGVHRGAAIQWHDGEWAGFRAERLRFPALGTSILLLANTTTIDGRWRALAIADAVLGDRLGAAGG